MPINVKSVDNIIPKNGRIVVRLEPIPEKTDGGIYYPEIVKDSKRMKVAYGEVIKVGEGVWNEDGSRIPCPVKVGDKVAYSKHVGATFKVEDDPDSIIKMFETKFIFGTVDEN